LLVDDEQALRRQIRRILFSQTLEGIIRAGAVDRVYQGLIDALRNGVIVVELRRFERAGRDRTDEKGWLGVSSIRNDLLGSRIRKTSDERLDIFDSRAEECYLHRQILHRA
jgi:hypothetical protein